MTPNLVYIIGILHCILDHKDLIFISHHIRKLIGRAYNSKFQIAIKYVILGVFKITNWSKNQG